MDWLRLKTPASRAHQASDDRFDQRLTTARATVEQQPLQTGCSSRTVGTPCVVEAIGGDARVQAILGVLAGDGAGRALVSAREAYDVPSRELLAFQRGGREATAAYRAQLHDRGITVEAMTSAVEAVLAGHAHIGMTAERLGTNRKAITRSKARYIAGGRAAVERELQRANTGSDAAA